MPDTRFTRTGRLLTGALFLGGMLLSVLMAARQSASNDALAREDFLALSGSIERHLMERMGRYQYGLRGARGAILTAGPETISRRAFRIYHESRNLLTEFEGARGFGFIRRVPLSQEAHFLELARQDGAPAFTIRQLVPHAGERYVIQYIEPVEDNRAALGLDIASNTERRLAAEQAMRSGQATLTSPITLMQARRHTGRGFLLLLPIYRPGLPTDTPAQREVATYGWAYAPLLIDEVLRDIGLDQKDYTLALFDAPRG
ncbi:MAG TPA: CHASE domain-containing protein, partial [Aquabacterium sp.]|nr:CHASE domain-containing protein [Aquabacterium sp.]